MTTREESGGLHGLRPGRSFDDDACEALLRTEIGRVVNEAKARVAARTAPDAGEREVIARYLERAADRTEENDPNDTCGPKDVAETLRLHARVVRSGSLAPSPHPAVTPTSEEDRALVRRVRKEVRHDCYGWVSRLLTLAEIGMGVAEEVRELRETAERRQRQNLALVDSLKEMENDRDRLLRERDEDEKMRREEMAVGVKNYDALRADNAKLRGALEGARQFISEQAFDDPETQEEQHLTLEFTDRALSPTPADTREEPEDGPSGK